MSIATVVTMGYGQFGSVHLLPTIGYGTPPKKFGCGDVLSAYQPRATALSSHQPGASRIADYQARATAVTEACEC